MLSQTADGGLQFLLAQRVQHQVDSAASRQPPHGRLKRQITRVQDVILPQLVERGRQVSSQVSTEAVPGQVRGQHRGGARSGQRSAQRRRQVRSQVSTEAVPRQVTGQHRGGARSGHRSAQRRRQVRSQVSTGAVPGQMTGYEYDTSDPLQKREGVGEKQQPSKEQVDYLVGTLQEAAG